MIPLGLIFYSQIQRPSAIEPSSMASFNLVTDSEISATITKMKSSPCSLDPIPTKLFKSNLL